MSHSNELGPLGPLADVPAASTGSPINGPPTLEQRVRAEEEALGEFLPDPFLVTDVYGTIRVANSAAATMLGGAKHDLIGRPLAVYVPLEARGEFRSALTNMLSTGERERWRTCLTAGGEALRVRITVGVRRDSQGRAGAVRWLIQREADDPRPASTEAVPSASVERTTIGAGTDTSLGKAAWVLSHVATVLAASFDYELNLRSALELTVPWLADWAILDLLSDGSGIRRVAVARASTEDRVAALALARKPPSLGDTTDPITRVLCGGPAELIRDVTSSEVARPVSTAWGRELMERLAPRSWISVPLRARGRTIGALTFLTARSGRGFVAAHLALAQQLADRAALAADNARLYEEATRASEAKSAFLAVMSHELRTPLTAIIGYTELLADGLFGAVSPEQRMQLGRVRESSEHLLHIVEEVLHYARLDARREKPDLEQIDLGSVVDQAITLVRPLAERKGLALRVEQPDAAVRWYSDSGRVRQILVNLLANAVKFTERGEVRLVALARDELVVFEVHDTGPGIPDALLGKIFEPFWQADQRFTRRQPGSGLGLSVTKELVALLGGGIDVRSALDVGSTFTVWVPRRTSENGAAAVGNDKETSSASPSTPRTA